MLDAIHSAIERDKQRRGDAALVAGLAERYATLSARERQIMSLVVIEPANKQIAAQLDLSEMTVKVHRGQVMRKMGARSLPKLVRMADRLTGARSNAARDFDTSHRWNSSALSEFVPPTDGRARSNAFG